MMSRGRLPRSVWEDEEVGRSLGRPHNPAPGTLVTLAVQAMKRRIALAPAGGSALLALAAVLAWGGPTWAATRHATVPMSAEAWYDEPPPCVSLIDCSTVPSESPYPAKTLHVAISGGRETARTYVVFSLPVPVGGRLIGGTLR